MLKPFKAYLVECCGSSIWLKLFRRINPFNNSDGDNSGNDADLEIAMIPQQNHPVPPGVNNVPQINTIGN